MSEANPVRIFSRFLKPVLTFAHWKTLKAKLSDGPRKTLHSRRYNRRTKQNSFHCFVTNLLGARYDIRTIHELWGDKDVSAFMVYPHARNKECRGARRLGMG